MNDDYKNSDYTRGHLAPSSHQKTEEDRNATFTLTNIVPQKKESNTAWSNFEENLQKSIKNICKDEMYVITGVIPYEPKPHKIKNRVFVPEYIWSAYCCINKDLQKKQGEHFPTYAAVGRNDPNREDDVVKKEGLGYNVKEMPLEGLEKILKKKLKMEITLFHGHCQAKKL